MDKVMLAEIAEKAPEGAQYFNSLNGHYLKVNGGEVFFYGKEKGKWIGSSFNTKDVTDGHPIYPLPKAKSLDDATPAEWDAASRAARMPVTEEEDKAWQEKEKKYMESMSTMCVPDAYHANATIGTKSKYHKRVKGVDIDVYDVLKAFNVTNPADAHAIKKMLMPGQRGAKDAIQDRREAIQSLERAIELEEQ